MKEKKDKIDVAFRVYFETVSAKYDGKVAEGPKVEFKNELPFVVIAKNGDLPV